MTLSDLLAALLGPLGLLMGALVLLYAGYREWIVPGVAFRRAQTRVEKLDALLEKMTKEKERLSDALVALTVSTKILAQIEAARQGVEVQ